MAPKGFVWLCGLIRVMPSRGREFRAMAEGSRGTMATERSKRVSIVIVNWKTPKLLASCLDSVFSDSRAREFEIWVVDNASGDGSVEMIEGRYPTVRVIANSENVGFPKACNQAISSAQGRYVLLLNPD